MPSVDSSLPEAALDAAIPNLDWTVLPDGAVASSFDARSGRLAMVSLETRLIRGLSSYPA